ncbi:MAG: serine/threonine-protein kinase [Pirellulaceae bacterium]
MAEEERDPLELRMDQVLAEYMSQCDSGNFPDREEFLGKHPELREQLEDLLGAADWIEELAGPTIETLGQTPKVEAGDEHTLVDDTLPHFGSIDAASSDKNGETLGGENKKKVDPKSPRPRQLESTQPVLPCQFGEYILERVLGRGGMGVVYLGRQSQLDRPVAVKMIRSGALASDEEVERFYAEARSAAKLQHPNIVTVYQCGEYDGHRYFSMDFVPGTDLSQMVREGPIDGRTAARYVRDVARAIQYAHDRGILHRDLKPANILVDDSEAVRITDFGLAKSVETDSGLTEDGAAIGTPSYMSPEQAAGKTDEQHHATDIYSLGAILFTLVAGRPPFKAPSVVETIMHVIHRPAPMLRSVCSNAHADIETIVDVCLQKLPDRRYRSAGELADDLDRYLQGTPILARPMSRIRRAWYWLLGVPIFGAVLDNRVVEPTDAHRWVQRGLISVLLMVVLAWFAFILPAEMMRNRMPSNVRVAAGVEGGSYDTVARSICEGLDNGQNTNAIAISTEGSSENLDRLERGLVDFALLQADAIGSPSVAVVAPLYYEAVHIVVRKSSGIRALADLRERRVNVGSAKAGTRGIAEMILESANLSLDDIDAVSFDWHLLTGVQASLAVVDEGEKLAAGVSLDAEDQTLPSSGQESDRATSESQLEKELERVDLQIDAAIVVSRLGSTNIAKLLRNGEFELLPFTNAMEFALLEPMFHPLLIQSKHYPNCNLPATGISAVTTTAFLAARHDAPRVLVQAVLRHLFTQEIVAATGIISADRAASWQGLVWHPAAREFFEPYKAMKPMTGVQHSTP